MTLEERIDQLEKKVAELEKKLAALRFAPQEQPEKKEVTITIDGNKIATLLLPLLP